ncbi:hypothetical protein NADFUDRAFT_41176 [Nadsonia fulvescens var. elongata DSM 6958]|uniref:Uncharacterized protein n=1 Tax=Nadsonia fulvescens var. elongata DSM 6958 TaxID=857566 RepID=A0A1E3PNV2_9ASCO|nr:hypothetical protein NADFUDRAFT_41176 [Nadsonia fulvescens var. elongata DSM 6958]
MAFENIKAYTEYLARIRSINVQVEFSSGLKPVRASLIDSKTLSIQYLDGSTQSISTNVQLATSADFLGSAEISFDLKTDSDVSTLTLRIPATRSPAQLRATMGSFSDVLKIPWSASYLRKMAVSPDFRCIETKDCVIERDCVKIWKDLPSENWAEMMDFWHCHKPNDPNPMSGAKSDCSHNKNDECTHLLNDDHGHSHPVQEAHTKYIDTKFLPSDGSVYIGQSYILVHVTNLSKVIKLENNFVVCNGNIIGKMESDTVAKLWKWKLWLESDNVRTQHEFKSYIFVSSVIEDLISSHAIHTFVLSNSENNDERLMVWVFNADISFTNLSNPQATPAFKIFYSTDKAQFQALKKTRGEVERVTFPGEVLDNLIVYLEHNTELMPKLSRRFGLWNVGVLEKYAV